MSKDFRRWKIDEAQLLPPSVQDYVPKDHLSRLIVSLVREELDLSAIRGSYISGLGQPPFDPRMMTALLLHGYASGLYSSRRIAKAAVERADFMMIVAGDPPDFRTISEFRRRHLKALAALFVQVLQLAEKAGLVKLGHVALDGTKIKANASKHKAMSYTRMKKREAELQAEVDRWLKAAEAADAEEDKLHGSKRGDEMPDWVADKQKRLDKIRAAKAELEAEAKAAAEEEMRHRDKAQAERKAQGRKKSGKTPAPPKQEPDGKTQRNFTDPESRILKTKDGYIQGYNAQAAVDAGAQIIVAHSLTHSMSDQDQLVPLIDGIKDNLGRKPKEASADAGYCSEANLAALAEREVGAYIATGRAKHAASAKRTINGPLTKAMRDKLKRAGWRSRYRFRKQIVEPVFGQIKQARGFRQFC
jgi:transposase